MSTVSTTSSSLQTDFMTLLVNQLRYQNPLEPISNSDMTAQLAQISQLEQMEKVSGFSQQLLQATQRAEAVDLIGKQIMYMPADSDTPVTVKVDGIDLSSGAVKVIAGGQSVSMDAIVGITNG
jgi:flagellar basal-body rod modification protein FlgD